MATVKKAQKGKTISAKYEPMKKGSFADVMGKTLDETDVFSKNYKKLTPAEEAKAAKQAAEIQKKSKAGKAFKNGGKMKKAQNGYDSAMRSTDRKRGLTSEKVSKDIDKIANSGLSKNPLFKKASEMKDTTTYKKSKSGGSFPDLNKDGKITRADILKGRGVIAKSGTKMKMGGKMAKQAAIAIAMKKAGKTPKKK